MLNFTITPDLENTFKGFVFELVIIGLWLVLLLLIWRHYRVKKNELTKSILFSFLFYWIAVIFSWLAKFIQLLFGYNDIALFPADTPFLWLIARITQFRISFSFIVIGAFFAYRFRAMVFQRDQKRNEMIMILVFSTVSVAFSLIVYDATQGLFDLISFFLVFLTLLLIYVPFAVEAFKLFGKIDKDEKTFRNGVFSFGLMCILFLMISVSMMLDRLVIILDPASTGYSIFYYMGWSSAILGVVSTFMGYIYPARK